MLIVNNVSKRYKGSDKNAVDCLNLKVEPGEVFGFIGPNGAGKTTTIKMIVGLLKSDSGTIHINGYDITKEPRKAKANFGYIPDNAEVYERLKGIEYLNLVADFYGVDKKTRVDKIIELSERFELKDYLNSTIKCYSRGTKRSWLY
jgi:ABC-2 type transport system ATP-binding protein